MMKKVRFSIGCRAYPAEIKRVVDLFKLNNLNLAGWVFTRLSEKADELEDKK